jgi:predicted ATPase
MLAARLSIDRLLTVVGPGGIGKTAVALSVAEASLTKYEDGVWLIDLAPISDALLVPRALASALGLEIPCENPLPNLIDMLRDKRMLLVLDDCEHVIEAAAALAVELLKRAPGVQILATSREPLRAEGERVCRLSSLPTPPSSSELTAAEALNFPAVQLFVERIADATNEFVLADAEAPIVADICRKLDGIPLAIEFAAAGVDAFGIRGLANRLDGRLRWLTNGRRTAPTRRRTMSASKAICSAAAMPSTIAICSSRHVRTGIPFGPRLTIFAQHSHGPSHHAETSRSRGHLPPRRRPCGSKCRY